ncbi:DUF2203 domain-containing protein [Sulfuracidifex metallicus]|jgi:hypothetical protein|uniref:DUF2203 family protein n=1 Tax=Sulfuracidifex metallicus DSM 6482 = JCM 9184 TaxID=523847 RepID=A0A6A9QUC3_SULME|nr:DUF2203 family protein [Sulfuracidifex metallicus]MUN29423.1 DUF2203 family protein [Sulfuracidifex metallicus DSM 6482 = JCM 9184]WOE50065.1 DUF2203 family protein [Sulfuracidifex metallicus DSM 6482 = JCM 9184]
MEQQYPYYDLQTARSMMGWIRKKIDELNDVKYLAENALMKGEKEAITLYTMATKNIIDEISNRGILIRDPAIGLVDFPAIINGKPAFLCWLTSEEDISFWHYVDEGFAGRRRITRQDDILSLL